MYILKGFMNVALFHFYVMQKSLVVFETPRKILLDFQENV